MCRISIVRPAVMITLLVVMVFAKPLAGETNEIDYGYWNYREGTDNVNVASVRSVTRVLDVWGKRIFSEIKNLLHSQPSALLPDYSRVRPLSESLNDLFREVSLLQRRITELNNRLATLEPHLRRHGYREEVERGGERSGGRASVPQSTRGGRRRLAKYTPRYMVRVVHPMN
uniref:Si:ch211-243a20.3 n=1 Tax=Scleropages formosus TaxID=113540 RepID=A0A8C9RPA5_SCLFO